MNSSGTLVAWKIKQQPTVALSTCEALIDGDKISLEYCPTNDMVADIQTKPATKLKLTRFEMFLFGT